MIEVRDWDKYDIYVPSIFHEMCKFPPSQTEEIQNIEEMTIEKGNLLKKSAEFSCS